VHSLTTRARAEADRRERLTRVLPPRPLPFVPLHQRPSYRRAIWLLRLVLSLLALLLLGAALWPSGKSTRPLRLADEQANQLGRPSAEYRP